MVFQEYALFPHMTVIQNISFGLQELATEEKKQRLSEVMELVRLTGLEGRYPHELSGGQQQRVALARTLAPRPVTVLLDEPFSNLDAGMRWEVRQEVETILRANRIATIFVTHDQEEAFAMADRVGVMTKGRLEQIDTPDTIYGCPSTPNVARLVGTCDFITGLARDGIAETEIGNLPIIRKNESIRNGSTVAVLVRPDDLRVTPDPNGNALVLSREFRGGETLLVVQTPSGTSIKCRQLSYTELRRGSKVSLTPASDAPFLAFEGK
jgi:iron(III) transport system ATP-binding protein